MNGHPTSHIFYNAERDKEAEEIKEEEAEEAVAEAEGALEKAEDEADMNEEDEQPGHLPPPHITSPLSLNSSPSLTLSSSLLSPPAPVSLPPSLSFHLPTSLSRHHPVYPFGRCRWLNRHAQTLTWLSMLATSVLIVGQIACDLYYLIGLNENLLSG